MYTEERLMPPRFMVLLALPFVATIIVLALLLALLPIPRAGSIPMLGVMLLEALVGGLLLASLSRIRIAIDNHALCVAFRLFFAKQIPLTRISTCSPSDARVWGMAYSYRGTRYRPRASGGRAVLLTLTNGAHVVFGSRHPDTVCDTLRAHRPGIARATGE